MAEQLDTLTVHARARNSAPVQRMSARQLEEMVSKDAFKHRLVPKVQKENLKTKSLDELREKLENQQKIKNNKVLINRLPDKGAKIEQICKEIEEEIANRTEPTGDIVELLESLKIVEKRPSTKLLKVREAQQETKESPKKFQAHRNEKYEAKFSETCIKTLKIEEEREAHKENFDREREVIQKKELQKMQSGKMPLILDSGTWRENLDNTESDLESNSSDEE